MKNSKLLQVINSLSPSDIRSFRKFLHSPFFNQRKDVMLLFEYIISNKDKTDPQNAFTRIYPDEPFEVSKFRLLMSYLFRLAEKYLTTTELFDDVDTQQLYVARAYKKRQSPKQVERIIKEGIKTLEQNQERNAEWYNLSFQLQFERFLLESADSPSMELNRQELSDTLDTAFLISKLRQACLIVSHKTIYKSEFDLGLLNPIFSYLKKDNYLKIPAIAVYYHCYLMLSNVENEHYFGTFKQLLLKNGTLFSTIEIRDLYLQAINYCIKKINTGATNFFSEAMDLYKEGLDKNYLLENGILSRFTYHNIVAAGIKTKNFEWVDQFILKYKKNIERKYRESSFSFSLAKLEYHRSNYPVVLDLLQKSNYRDLLLNLGAKTLLLKTYFELEELDLLDAHLEAMKNYIRRKRVIGYHQKNYFNIIQVTRKLISTNFYDKKEIENLRKLISKTNPLTESDWLLAQIRKLQF